MAFKDASVGRKTMLAQPRQPRARRMTGVETAPDLAARMAGIVSLADFEPLARAVMDPAGYDYVAGGAWDELTLADNLAAWRRRRLRPRVLVDVSVVDTATTMLGVPVAMPVAIAPMATQILAHPDAEIGDGPGSRGPWDPDDPVDDRVALDRDGGGGRARRDPLVPALRPVRLGRDPIAGRTGRGRRVRAIVLTVDLPLLGYRVRDRRSRFRPPGARQLRGDAGDARAATDPRVSRPRPNGSKRPSPGGTSSASGPGRRCRSSSRGSSPLRTRISRSSMAPTRSSSAITGPASSIGSRRRPTPSERSWTRWRAGPRCGSTAGIRSGLDIAIALGARGARRPARPGRLLGAGRRRLGRRRACARDPARGVETRDGAPRDADTGRHRPCPRRHGGRHTGLSGPRVATSADPARHRRYGASSHTVEPSARGSKSRRFPLDPDEGLTHVP